MIESASGIILRTRPLTETSVIVHWLTPHLGRLATVAKGARRPKSAFRGKLDLFYEGDFAFQRSRRSELHALREVTLRETHAALRTDMDWLQQAAYAAALVEQTSETESPLPEIHALVTGFVAFLPNQPPKPRNIFAFELKLLRALGLAPDVTESRLTADLQKLVTALTETEWAGLDGLKATASQARAAQQFLQNFLVFHLGKVPASRVAALLG